MSKIITFSRQFPAYHPRAGHPTHFVEKIYNGFNVMALGQEFIALKEDDLDTLNKHLPYNLIDQFKNSLTNRLKVTSKKYHTIRSGNRWKVGDIFSPRVWGVDINPKSGKSGPYHSKQIALCDDLELKKVFDIRIDIEKDYISIMIDSWLFYEENSKFVTQSEALQTLAKNDGLSVEDFKSWFNWGKKPFQGQILCWNNDIEY